MFDQLSAEILASLIKGFPRTTRTTTTTTRTTTTTKQNVDPAVHLITFPILEGPDAVAPTWFKQDSSKFHL
jgi:hypothetical protein